MSDIEATMDGEQIAPQLEENQQGDKLPPPPDEKLWAPRKRGFIGEALAPVEGFGITFKSMFRKPVTEEYPEKRVPLNPRYHGRHQLNRYPDGLERCIGCELCAWACPADAIFVEAGANTPEEQYSPGERFGKVYQINYTRCIFCGYCIQACPTRALTMTTDFEIAGPTRASLIYEKKDLLAPLSEGMLEAPHPMAEGMTDDDYYDGKVTGATEAQKAWVRQNRLAQTGEEGTNDE